VGTGRRYRGGLVDLGTGLISREIFVNEEIYAEELERVFPRAWLFVDFLRQYYIRYSGPAGPPVEGRSRGAIRTRTSRGWGSKSRTTNGTGCDCRDR
jgi:hypothetical protein